MNNAFMARLLPRTHLASTQSTLTTDLAKTTTKYSYASAGLKAATAQWERINASADLCADLHVKKAKFLAEQAGWQCDLMEVEEKLWDIKEQEINSDDRELEATQLRVKKGLLKGLLKKIVEALRGVEMLVGPAEQDYIYWSNREVELLRRMREWRNCTANLDSWEMKTQAALVDSYDCL